MVDESLQVEGAFVMGLGEFLTEVVVFDSTGHLLSNGSFEDKPLVSLDIPQKMNVRTRLPGGLGELGPA